MAMPRKEDPDARFALLERIVASYISGIHHDDVIPDEFDTEAAKAFEAMVDSLFEAWIH